MVEGFLIGFVPTGMYALLVAILIWKNAELNGRSLFGIFAEIVGSIVLLAVFMTIGAICLLIQGVCSIIYRIINKSPIDQSA